MLQWRFGLFWGGATFSGAFSGLLAYGISFMSGAGGLLGWSWIFVRRLNDLSGVGLTRNPAQIIEGLISIVVAIIAFIGQFLMLVRHLGPLISLNMTSRHMLQYSSTFRRQPTFSRQEKELSYFVASVRSASLVMPYTESDMTLHR